MKLPFYWVGVDLPHLVCQIWAVRIGIKICEIAVLHGVDLPHLVGQIWAVRIGIKICEIDILLGAGRSATPGQPNMKWIRICQIAILHGGRSVTPGWPNMSCQNRNQNLWNCHSNGGGRSATPGWPNMHCQNRNQNLWNCCSTGVDLPHLVSQIWAVRIGIKICEIAILYGGGRSATPGLPNMSCQNRNQNLWNCHSMGWG